MESQISELFRISTSSLKDIVDVDTIVGKTITVEPGIAIIPISKVKCSFATGGTDQGKPKVDNVSPFGGATGGSVTITPVAFLVINKEDVRLLHLEDETHLYERIIDQIPEAISSIKDLFSGKPKISKVEVIEKKEK
jgi:sporulation protein YtfJ